MPERTIVDALPEFWFLCFAPINGRRFTIDLTEAAICLVSFRPRLYKLFDRQGRLNKYVSLAAQLLHSRGQRFVRRLQNKRRPLEQLALRQKAMTIFVRCLRENMLKPCCQARHAVSWQAQLHRDLIGSAKT